MHRKFCALVIVALVQAVSTMALPVQGQEGGSNQWYRGNLHTHSLWSDGDDFPDMIVKWYKDNGYQFLAMTDHNILSNQERWMEWRKIQQRGGDDVLKKYQAAMGDDWVETRGSLDSNDLSVRLKKFDEMQRKFDEKGKFLLLTGEEISDSVDGLPIHLNATNLVNLLRPARGSTVREVIQNNLRAAQLQAEKENRKIIVHLNHPNFGWAVTAEDLAFVTLEKYFEVYNGHPAINHLGDKTRPGVEKMWDIANTLRLAELDSPPLYGLGTDDSHNYHGKKGGASTGRGWIMVRSAALEPDAIMTAIQAGDFYASSGVSLIDVTFDPSSRKLSLKIQPEDGVTYQTHFIGTPKNFEQKSRPSKGSGGKKKSGTRIYSADVGKIFASVDGVSPEYQLRGNELYVRAVVTSSKTHPNPSFKFQKEQAWTQPVGWAVRGKTRN